MQSNALRTYNELTPTAACNVYVVLSGIIHIHKMNDVLVVSDIDMP